MLLNNTCSDCGGQYVVKQYARHHDPYLGDFIVEGAHRECPHCGLAEFSFEMYDALQKMKQNRTQELLSKNYPINAGGYISIDDLCISEHRSSKELLQNSLFNRWVYHLDCNDTRFYLKKSYLIYRETNRPGFFDITYRHR